MNVAIPTDKSLETLNDWEILFVQKIQTIENWDSGKTKVASLLPVIPDHHEWENYLIFIKSEWRNFKENLDKYPACLLVLYSGITFYEYQDNTFWPHFAKCVGAEPLIASHQQQINNSFNKAGTQLGMKILLRNNGTDFIGSAIYYIGIPLSLWEGFLGICEWAVWQKDWNLLSESDWTETMSRRCGGLQRLKRFLIENRETASSFIQKMINVREAFMNNKDLVIENFLYDGIRSEYFDEVPETADFLRPQNPESVFKSRARLVWNDRRRQLVLQLPGLESKDLPAEWEIGDHSQAASRTPDELVLNSRAFSSFISLGLKLKSGEKRTQRIKGVRSWGLFDIENGSSLINPDREEIPLKSYVLISQAPIEIAREGFDQEESQFNEKFELTDGTICFVTYLWPIGKHARLTIKGESTIDKTIRFRPRPKIEVHFFAGWNHNTAYSFYTKEGTLGLDHLPVLSVAIPIAYFKNNKTELERLFKITIDNRPADGSWNKVGEHADKEFWQYFWSARPVLEFKPGVKVNDLSDLANAFRSANLIGEHTFAVKADRYVENEFKVKIVSRSSDLLDACWKGLPGSCLPLFLLCGASQGMKWEDLLLAKDIIAPKLDLSYTLLRRYAKFGFLKQQGNRWLLAKSQAELKRTGNDQSELNFCGDPSILWGLYNHLRKMDPTLKFPLIKVINEKGEIPYLQTEWSGSVSVKILWYLRNCRVVLAPIQQWIQ